MDPETPDGIISEAEEEPVEAMDPEGQPEAEQDAEPADTGEPPAEGDEEQPFYEVQIDGKTERVSLEEALKGYQRHADYTRSKMAIADEKRAFEAERLKLEAAAQESRARLQEQFETFMLTGEAEPDWDKLLAQNPTEYLKEKRRWEKVADARTQARAKYDAYMEQDRTERQQAEVSRLLTKIPEWRDQAVVAKDVAAIQAVAADYGFTPQEFASIEDHRVVVALRDAAKWRNLQASKPGVVKRVAEAPVKAPPSGSAKQDKSVDARRAFDRNPSIANAMKLNF